MRLKTVAAQCFGSGVRTGEVGLKGGQPEGIEFSVLQGF